MKLRGILIAVLSLAVLANAFLIVDVMTGGGFLPGTQAANDKAEMPKSAKASAAPDPQKEAENAYRALVAELTEQKNALDKKARELAERERQVNVLRDEMKAAQATPGNAGAGAPAAGQAKPAVAGDSFKKLVKAYGGMEAENAARALAELYARDRDIAVDLVIALPARKASALLDALTASKPSLAADISVEISHRDEPAAQ